MLTESRARGVDNHAAESQRDERFGGDVPRGSAVDELVDAARHNEAVGWVRLPIFLVISSFLFVFLGPFVCVAWLSLAIAVDRVSVWLRKRTAAGQRQWAHSYFLSVVAVSFCWILHAGLIWSVGGEMQRIVAVIDLFMVMIYGVTGGQHSLRILGALVGPPLAAFLVMILTYLWTHTDLVAAICGSVAAVGACLAVLLTAVSTYRSARSVHRANQKLKAALVELDHKRREAEDASRAKNDFVALMSHEVRTPMNGVLGMLELLVRSKLGAEQQQHAVVAQKSARDLLHLLDDIIDISRLEARQITLVQAPFQPHALTRDVEALFRLRARERGLKLDLALDSSVPDWVNGDGRRIRQILINLVGNALKFTETGSVVVSATYMAEQGTLRFEVRDTGIGLSPDVLGKVFSPFYQVDASSTRAFEGSGLGLAICKQLAELMGGQIGVSSASGRGSTFWFTAPGLAIDSPVDGEAIQEVAAVAGPPLRILVADDNFATQRILSVLLAELGHAIKFVANGRDAVAAAAAEEFDVVIMDVMMPVMDGLTATRHIRELGGRAGAVPILGLTANALTGDRDRYITAGMTDCLAKPIDVAALATALACIDTCAHARPDSLAARSLAASSS